MKKKITGLTLCTLLFALSFPAHAQQPGKVPRIGMLFPASPSPAAPFVDAFRRGLHDLGYAEGKNIVIEYRFAEGKLDRFPKLAAELVALKIDVIVAGSTPAALAAQQATKTIAIVFAAVADPVSVGLVASLPRPGANVTGLTTINSELAPKRLELLKETVATVSRVAVLHNPSDASNVVSLQELQGSVGALRLTLQPVGVRDPEEFDHAFSVMSKEGINGLIVEAGILTMTHRTRIVGLAAKARLPAMYGEKAFVEDGGLMSYAANFAEQYRRAATYVDKILKGAKPTDLPVQQPTKFEFVINLKTAKQIGLTIPPNVLFRADKVIK